MAFWSGLLTHLGFGASKRIDGVQSIEPSGGRLTTRSVTPDTALQISSVFACVRLLAETIAGLPLNFYELSNDGSRKLRPDHYLNKLLNGRPNRYQTRVEFFETLVFQLSFHGNSYHRVDRNKSGQIYSLLPLMTPQVTTILNKDGSITHRYDNSNGTAFFADESIWHNKLFGNGIIGLSPLEYARNSLGIAISAEDRVSSMANNGFKPSGILMIDKILKPEQRDKIRQSFSDLAEGGEDALRILEAGMTYQQVSMNPKDVQLLESRRFQTEDICRFFGVPSVLVNDTSATTVWGSGIEQIITGFYKLGLRPYLERIEASITNWLLEKDERQRIVPEFDFDLLLRGDEKTRYETYKTAIGSGIRTPNECRKSEGLLPQSGGDDLFMPQQFIPIKKIQGGKHEKKSSNN